MQNLEEKFLDWKSLTHMAILRAKFKSLDFKAHCNILQISVQNYTYKQILKNVWDGSSIPLLWECSIILHIAQWKSMRTNYRPKSWNKLPTKKLEFWEILNRQIEPLFLDLESHGIWPHEADFWLLCVGTQCVHLISPPHSHGMTYSVCYLW